MPENVWLLLLEAVGATVVFTQGSIFKGFRDHGPKLWQEFAHCPLCVGVWVGMLLRVLQLRDLTVKEGTLPLSWVAWTTALVGFGATTGMFALLVKRAYDYLESASVRDDFEVSSKTHAANMAAFEEQRKASTAAFDAETERLKKTLGNPYLVPKKKSD